MARQPCTVFYMAHMYMWHCMCGGIHITIHRQQQAPIWSGHCRNFIIIQVIYSYSLLSVQYDARKYKCSSRPKGTKHLRGSTIPLYRPCMPFPFVTGYPVGEVLSLGRRSLSTSAVLPHGELGLSLLKVDPMTCKLCMLARPEVSTSCMFTY